MSELDPRLARAFEALRHESTEAPRPEAMQAARAAMHQARAVQAAAGGMSFGARLRGALTAHRLMAAGTGAVAGVAAVAALGWNAPASSPLHAVRVAHEQISLAMPGSDRVSLDLGFAESRLREARQDGSGSALDEAQSLLDDARTNLAAGAPLWSRWQDDEQELAELRHGDHEGGTSPGSGGSDDGSGGGTGSGGATGTESQGGSTSSGEHEGGSTESTTSSSREDGGTTTGGESSSTTTSTAERSSSSTGGDSGGGGATTSSSSSSSSDGGGGGTDVGSGGGSSSSTSSTMSSDGH